jgi:hypothetical protein
MTGPLKKTIVLVLVCILLSSFIEVVSASDLTTAKNNFIFTSYSADDSYAVKSSSDNNIYFFDAGKNAVPWTYNIGRYIGSIAISPDGKYVSVGCDGGLIFLFDQEGNLLWKKPFGDAAIRSIAFSKDGNYIDASNTLNQAFYINRDGSRVNRPIPTSAIPTATISSIPTTSANFLPSKIDLPFVNEGGSYVLLAIGLCFLIIIGVSILRGRQKTRFFGKTGDLINLKNLTSLSLILIFIGLGFQMYQVVELSKLFIFFGVIGFIFSYYLYAVFSWGADDKIAATSMITVPLTVYFLSASKIPASMNIILYIFLVFFGYGIVSAILLFISDKLKWGVDRYFLRIKSRSHRFFFPNMSYVILGIVLVSFLTFSFGNAAIFSDNVNSVLRSTTNFATNPQYVPAPPASQIVTFTTVQTPQPIQTKSIDFQIPIVPKNYETGLSSRSFAYVLRGKSSTLNVNLYSGVYDEISSAERPSTCTRYNYDTSPCTSEEIRQYYLKYLDEPDQKKYLDNLVKSIESATPNKDDQARIAISLVQQIPYDYNKFYRLSSSTSAGFEKTRYPYEVLYDGKGVCSEKSALLAYLLRGLGYGVVLFEFQTENHMAVGVKSPDQYAFRNTGYAFVEAAAPSIPTDDQADYVGAGKLISSPSILAISDGASFDSISEESKDATMFNQLQTLSKSSGGILDQNYYYMWMGLVQKYGLKTSNY